MTDRARTTLATLAAERGESLAALSRMLRRNPAYLQQFVQRGTPRRLAEADRRLLAMHFDIDEHRLGGPAPVIADFVAVPWLTVAASAGPGAIVDREQIVRVERFSPDMLRDAGIAPGMASLIDARGDSMLPGIVDGDRLLVDRGDRQVTGMPGIFVLRRDDELAVKRLMRRTLHIEMRSDNRDYPTSLVGPGEIDVIGRVKLLLRVPC